jgi:phosphoribosylformimino-5-aminoimidazole carboxamide ribotide isomerase
MDLYPAIDLRDGAAVRLIQGDFDRQHGYGDPVELARRYVEGGATWIHVVDLDAARTGKAANRDLVLTIAKTVDVPVQTGGGVRTAADAEALLGGGVARVVLGTAALRDPELVVQLAHEFPGQVAVGLDHRGGGAEVAVSGWERGGGVTLAEALDGLVDVPIASVVVTAIERDGTLSGPDTVGLASVLALTGHSVVASGGVSAVADLVALASIDVGGRRLVGAIVGKALVDGLLTVEEAVAACAISG